MARVEGRVDAVMEEIKALINNMTLQFNDLSTQVATIENSHNRGSILG